MKRKGDSYRVCPRTGRCYITLGGQDTGKWFSSPERASRFLGRGGAAPPAARGNPGDRWRERGTRQIGSHTVETPGPADAAYWVDLGPDTPAGQAWQVSGGVVPASIRRSGGTGPWFIVSGAGTWSVWSSPDKGTALRKARRMLREGIGIGYGGQIVEADRTNPRTSYRGVKIQRVAGVTRYRHPGTGKRVSVSQREGGFAEAKRRIDHALAIKQRFAANPKRDRALTRFDRS